MTGLHSIMQFHLLATRVWCERSMGRATWLRWVGFNHRTFTVAGQRRPCTGFAFKLFHPGKCIQLSGITQFDCQPIASAPWLLFNLN